MDPAVLILSYGTVSPIEIVESMLNVLHMWACLFLMFVGTRLVNNLDRRFFMIHYEMEGFLQRHVHIRICTYIRIA